MPARAFPGRRTGFRPHISDPQATPARDGRTARPAGWALAELAALRGPAASSPGRLYAAN